MCIIHDRIEHELRMITNARSAMKTAEQRLRILFNVLKSQDAVAANRQEAPACTPVAEDMLQRADQAVVQAGYERLGKIAVTVPAPIKDLDLLADAPNQFEDMRALERTASGGYRCTLRRGKSKRRLIPDVFGPSATRVQLETHWNAT